MQAVEPKSTAKGSDNLNAVDDAQMVYIIYNKEDKSERIHGSKSEAAKNRHKSEKNLQHGVVVDNTLSRKLTEH